jgi:hypothetical protein
MLDATTMALVEESAHKYQPPIRNLTADDYVGEEAIDAENNLWGKLIPLPEVIGSEPDEFPHSALGKILGDASRAIAHDVQAPDSLAAGSVLAAASLASSPLANVVLPHGQRSPLSLFVITGAGSGDRKSAVDAVACHEIEEVRKQQAREYSKAMQNFDKELALKRKGAPEPTKPIPKSLTTGNATIEGISRLLKCQSSVGVFSAEGGEMLGGHSMRDDKRAAGISFFLKAWSGESLDSLRGGEGLTVLLGRRIALHVLVQPVLLQQLLRDPLAQGQGLLARCLIAQPNSLAGHRPYRHTNPHKNPAVERYNAAIKQMLQTPPEFFHDGDGYELKPRDLHMSEAARLLWISFYNSIESQQAEQSELDAARPFASKAAEQVARIAGIISLIENPEATVISGEIMDGAIQVTGFYLSEHLRLTGSGKEELKDRNLRLLFNWMQTKGAVIPKNEVLQKITRNLRDLQASGLNPLLKELVDRGYILDLGKAWRVRDV